ncbi:MAG: sigma 54-interacting transcriptional regulator, partial [Deltaproteobacteria bacterium]|nr:sigma 54-interacting transcriptional regulator [Deltaproteobacteria bacterium]
AAEKEEAFRWTGGRPLLWREFLRLRGGSGLEPSVERSRPLLASVRSRWKRLSEKAGRALALFLVAWQDPLLEEAARLGASFNIDFGEELLELEREGILSVRPSESFRISLTTPSFRTYWNEALPAPLAEAAHRAWLRAGRAMEASRRLHHALGCGDIEAISGSILEAVTEQMSLGEYPRAADWIERALRYPLDDELRGRIHAQQAPIYFRLGHHSEALEAYSHWYRLRGDDASKLQTVKLHYYQGLVYFSWGKKGEAETSLLQAVNTGTPRKHPALRPYQARALHLLATAAQRAGNLELARERLVAAEGLGVEDPDIEAENLHRLGELDMSLLRLKEARESLEAARLRYETAGKAGALAATLHSLSMLERLEGRDEAALKIFDRIFALVPKGESVVQWARYRGNRALLSLEAGRLSEAHEFLRSSEKILRLLGNEEDRRIMHFQFAAFYSSAGLPESVEKIFRVLAGSRAELEEAGLWEWILLLRGESAMRFGQWESARRLAEGLKSSERASPWQSESAEWMRFRSLAAEGPWNDAQAWRNFQKVSKTIALPAYAATAATLEWMMNPSEESEDFSRLVAKIEAEPRFETRLELLGTLALHLRRKRLPGLAAKVFSLCQEHRLALKRSLPEEFTMDFEKNRKLSDLEAELAKPLTEASSKPTRFRQFCEIARQIYHLDDLSRILERVMDAAIEITAAERGFLLLKTEDGSKGDWKGYEIKTARHLNHQTLNEKEFKISFSAMEAAIQKGTPMLTENAMLDERLQEMLSVQKYQLKSILAVPLEISGKILGAIYLDHTYKIDCFSEEDIALVNGFSGQVSMAIEKARKLEKLQRNNSVLATQVETQSKHIETLAQELEAARKGLKHDYKEIVGASPKMLKVFQLMDHVAQTRIPVWVFGESGTGKELIARSLHEYSDRKAGPFVSENCSSIPENLLESELFGHKKGSFTHADRDRIGLFEQASGGTLFLDEVADMPSGMQVKLLRVLQEGEVRPVGANKKVKIDVRLITASNRDLRKLVKQGKFREDLFYRINGMMLALPPLRERREDLPALTHHLVRKISQEYGLKSAPIDADVFDFLLGQSWPGNIRQLEGFLRNLLLFAQGNPITRDILRIQLENTEESEGGEFESLPEEPGSRSSGDGKDEERSLIIAALKKYEMDKQKVADDLGLSIKSIYAKMEKMDIPRKPVLLRKFLERH